MGLRLDTALDIDAVEMKQEHRVTLPGVIMAISKTLLLREPEILYG